MSCEGDDVLERIHSALRTSTNKEERKKLEEAVCFPLMFQTPNFIESILHVFFFNNRNG